MRENLFFFQVTFLTEENSKFTFQDKLEISPNLLLNKGQTHEH